MASVRLLVGAGEPVLADGQLQLQGTVGVAPGLAEQLADPVQALGHRVDVPCSASAIRPALPEQA